MRSSHFVSSFPFQSSLQLCFVCHSDQVVIIKYRVILPDVREILNDVDVDVVQCLISGSGKSVWKGG